MKIMASSFSFHPWGYSMYNLIHLIVGSLAYFEVKYTTMLNSVKDAFW